MVRRRSRRLYQVSWGTPGHQVVQCDGSEDQESSGSKFDFRSRLRSVPRVLVTDTLGSYRVAHRELMSSVEHRRSRYLNNRAENSHQPTRQRERAMKRFQSSRHAQRFLSASSGISAHFRPRRHLLSATQWRTEMADRFAVWRQVTTPDAAA